MALLLHRQSVLCLSVLLAPPRWGQFFEAASHLYRAMKYALIAAVVFVGCVVLLGPARDSLVLPAGVVSIMDDLGHIF